MPANYAVIENNLVVNIVVSEPEYAAEQGWIRISKGAGIGWTYINGNFINENIPVIDEKDKIKSNIVALESSVTPRRQREAILGTDNGWLANVDLEIAELRGQL